MPNHCNNELCVSGPAGLLDEWHDANLPANADPELDRQELTFTSTLPMPAALEGTQCRGASGTKSAKDKAESKRLIRLHGYDNWYEWRLDNWGTKWDAYETRVDHLQDDPKLLRLRFLTAWSPPVPWLRATAQAWPGLKFEHSWDEPGMGDCGQGVYGGLKEKPVG